MNGLTAQPMKGEQLMKITLEGEPKEIAALVLAVQERQNSCHSFKPSDSSQVGRTNVMASTTTQK